MQKITLTLSYFFVSLDQYWCIKQYANNSIPNTINMWLTVTLCLYANVVLPFNLKHTHASIHVIFNISSWNWEGDDRWRIWIPLGSVWLSLNEIILFIFLYTILHKKMKSLNVFILKNETRLKNDVCNHEFWHSKKMKKLPHKKKYCKVSHICKWIHLWW